MPILDQYGKAYKRSLSPGEQEILRRQFARAKYDAAQTTLGNENHWINADNLSPNAAASYAVRQKLRARSRYEVIENNPYLKGTVLTIANDFVGGGPTLRITDKRLSRERKRIIELRWRTYIKKIKLRQKLWRMRLAKIVDGEAFALAYINDRIRHPVRLDYVVLEADQISSENFLPIPSREGVNEIDGIRFDNRFNPLEYHVLNNHPGGNVYTDVLGLRSDGQWIDEKFMIHWFRQDRGWLRGIPEMTPSLPLCSILRRYTLAILRHAETAADFSAVLETDGPAGTNAWTDGSGNLVQDDPFDSFPLEHGTIMNLPWGYKLKQLDAVPLGAQYDEFVGSMLREIIRPILVPFNIASGTSKDSNMATSIVDHHIYKGGQISERTTCNEDVLDQVLEGWWQLGIRTEDYFDDSVLGETDFLLANPSLKGEPPQHEFGWDNIGLEHTDPSKVAAAIETLHQGRFLTDRDIQERYYNRDVEDWREEVLEDDEFREQLIPLDNGSQGSNSSNVTGE